MADESVPHPSLTVRSGPGRALAPVAPFGHDDPLPLKGRTTSSYWSFDSDVATREDIAWACDLPTIHANRIAGLVAFPNDDVDLYVEGTLLPRPAASTPAGPPR